MCFLTFLAYFGSPILFLVSSLGKSHPTLTSSGKIKPDDDGLRTKVSSLKWVQVIGSDCFVLRVLFDTKLNLMIKLLQLPSDTLSVPALSSPLIENSHTSRVIHPRSLFSPPKATQKGPWAKPTQTSHRRRLRGRAVARSPFFLLECFGGLPAASGIPKSNQ